MQVIDYNGQNQTFTLRSVKGDGMTKLEIPLKRIKRIERYGVSIYDLNNMPDQINKSHYEWICNIRTSDS
jgi:predicted ATPase with chaperone activity